MKSKIKTTTAIRGVKVWKSVITPELTEVSAVVAIAVKAPGRTKAATYIPIARNITSTTIATPSFIALDARIIWKAGESDCFIV